MRNISISNWSDFKTIIASKKLLMQYYDSTTKYNVFAVENSSLYWEISLLKDEGSDVTDFENNYKANCNAPLEVRSSAGRPARTSPSPQPNGTVQKLKGYQILLTSGNTDAYVDISFDHTVYIKGGNIVSAGVDEDDYVNAKTLLVSDDTVVVDGIIDHGYMIPNVKLDFVSPECMEFPSYLKLRVYLHCHTSAASDIKANVLVEYFE